jgi:P27 family predicted phage terminase small subunit
MNESEPTPEPGRPTCPAFLEREAKTEWRRIVPELEALGLLSRVDRVALAAYCQSWARWKQAEEVISRDGMSLELKKQNRMGREYVYGAMPRPEVAISQRERMLMKGFLVEFGLTPASRSRIHVPPQPKKDAFEEWAGGRRGAA